MREMTKMLELLQTEKFKGSFQYLPMSVAEHARLLMTIPPSKNTIKNAELHDKLEKEYATLFQQ
jgi:hypothetical protein